MLTYTYELLRTDCGEAFKCLLCGIVSHHPHDVSERHCSKCNRFAEQTEDDFGALLYHALTRLRPDLGNAGKVKLVTKIFHLCSVHETPIGSQ